MITPIANVYIKPLNLISLRACVGAQPVLRCIVQLAKTKNKMTEMIPAVRTLVRIVGFLQLVKKSGTFSFQKGGDRRARLNNKITEKTHVKIWKYGKVEIPLIN